MKIEERLFSAEEVAERLGMSRYTIGEWLRSGRLKGRRIGRFWRVKERDLQAFIDRPPPVNMAAVQESMERIQERLAEEAERNSRCTTCSEVFDGGEVLIYRRYYGEEGEHTDTSYCLKCGLPAHLRQEREPRGRTQL
jgi:excisionase family DNA binding protein